MRHLRAGLLRVIAFVRDLVADDADRTAREEMESHLEMEVAEYVRRGLSPDEARRHAALSAGGLTLATEQVRAARGLPWAESLLTDVRYAARSLRSQPAFTAAVVLTLALGIGSTAGMFTILNAVILRPLPYPQPGRILSLSVASRGSDMEVADAPNYYAWAAESRQLEAVAAYGGGAFVVRTPAGPQEIRGTPATAPYFRVFGVAPLLGRVFTPDEDRPGAPRVVLLSEQLWRGQFASDSAIIGRSIAIDGEPTRVIGVMPASFTTPNRAQLWMPYRLRAPEEGVMFYYSVVARMRPGATQEMVQSELVSIQRRLDASRPEDQRGLEPVVMTLHERRYGDSRRPLLLLFAAVGVLLLITCANLANLSLARATRRQREFSLRVALGARRWRLARYVLTECMLLSLAGAAMGLALAAASLGYFVRISPRVIGSAEGIGIDATVLLFTAGVAVLATVLFGMLPALGAARVGISNALAAGSARVAGGHRTLRRAIVVLQLATALVLVVGAGLVARTFWTVTSIRAGFNPESVLTARIQLPWASYTDTTGRAFMEELLERVRSQPNVEAATLSAGGPLMGARMSTVIRAKGKPDLRYEVVPVTPGYFETYGTRITEGRAIGRQDGERGMPVAVVSGALARTAFPGRSAIGERLTISGNEVTIVGVTEDVRQRELEADVSAVAFVPLAQSDGWRYLTLAMRASGSTVPLTRAVTRIMQDMDAALPPPPFQTMDEVVAEKVAPRKFMLVLLGLFAGLAGLLAAVGLHGVLACFVAEQTRELGIRAALGADRARVMRYIVGQGAALTLAGLACGLIAAVAAVRLLQAFVYGIGIHDAWTFSAAAGVLAAVAMLACCLPALRAGRVDPVIALRAE